MPMPLLPMDVLGIWARGLLSLMAPGFGVHLLGRWANRPRVDVGPDRDAGSGLPAVGPEVHPPLAGARRRIRPPVQGRIGLNRGTACLAGGLFLLGCSMAGSIVYFLLRKPGPDDPRQEEGETSARGETEHRIRRPDGSVLRVVCCGPEIAPAIVLTHGWGANSSEWHYAKVRLADRYRLILWDLPGLGLSEGPADGDWNLEKLAGHLDAVLGLAGDAPVFLLGHSIGGMVVLTYCRLHPEALGTRVRGLILAHTTYTNPLRTTSRARLHVALQKPVLEPLCYLMIATSPLVRLMNALTYLNGTLHFSLDRGVFSGRETRQQLDFTARYFLVDRPSVIARGLLAMFRYDATDVLHRIDVPTLIVAGDRDVSTTASASLEMAERIPDARLVMLHPARHMGHFEHHARFTDEVDRFVASCRAAARR